MQVASTIPHELCHYDAQRLYWIFGFYCSQMNSLVKLTSSKLFKGRSVIKQLVLFQSKAVQWSMCSIMFLHSLPSIWLRLSSIVYHSLRPQPLLTMLPWKFALRIQLQSSDLSSFFKGSLSGNSYSGSSSDSTCFGLWCLLPLCFSQSLQSIQLSFLQSLLC
jgi:hypothetical protein